MSYTRTVYNETNLTLDATLYIQAGADPGKLYGTLNITIPANQSMEIAYGDLRNSFLCGLRISPSPADPLETLHCRVSQSGDVIDQWLNAGDSLRIDVEHLILMESAVPFNWLKTISMSD